MRRRSKLLQIGTPEEIIPAGRTIVDYFTGATKNSGQRFIARNGKFRQVDFGDGKGAEAGALQSSIRDKGGWRWRQKNIASAAG